MSKDKGEAMATLVKRFRNSILDTSPDWNILKGDLEYTDEQIEGFIVEALHDINEAEPRTTNFRIERFPKTRLLLDGALVFMLKARGLAHLRNQVSYSDAGFSVNLDDKSGHYAQWLQSAEAQYREDVRQFKRTLIPRMRGVSSPAGNYWW